MAATLYQHWSPVLRKKSSLRIVPCNITFKPDANGRNTVGQQLPTLFDVARCIRLHTLFMLLRVVGSCCAKFETGQTFSYMQTDVTTPNIVASCWPTMLRPFAPGSRLRSHGTGRFSTVEKFDRTLRFTWNRSIFSRCSHGTVEPGWILTFVRGFTICPCAESYLSNPKWRLPAELPRIHATASLPFKN